MFPLKISLPSDVTKSWLSANATRCRSWSWLVTAFTTKRFGMPLSLEGIPV